MMNIDKARAVADKALKKISLREEGERMNVWVARLNLENAYGTSDTVEKGTSHRVRTVISGALGACSVLAVHAHSHARLAVCSVCRGCAKKRR